MLWASSLAGPRASLAAWEMSLPGWDPLVLGHTRGSAVLLPCPAEHSGMAWPGSGSSGGASMVGRRVLPVPAGLSKAHLGVPGKQHLSWVCSSAPGYSQFPRHPACFDLTVVFRISSSLLSQKPPAPWQQLWTCKPGGGFYYRIWSWIFTRLMSTMEVKIFVLFLGLNLCWGSAVGHRGSRCCHSKDSGTGMSLAAITWDRGMGRVLLMGSSAGGCAWHLL